jgi:hypothetical protein
MLQITAILSNKFQTKIDEINSKIDDNDNSSNEPDNQDDPVKKEYTHPTIHTNFHLPISYLEPSHVYEVHPIVSTDLELIPASENKCMYDYLFQPKHLFAKQMIHKWQHQFTTDVDFLNDSQHIITDLNGYKLDMNTGHYEVNCENILNIWKDVKDDDSFMDKYGYMDWDMLKHLNESTSFLQAISVINVASPLISLIIPIIFLIFPFLLLKIQGIPITFSIYIDVLKDIAKNHFIGKALCSMESLSWDKLIYMIVTFGLYLLQIYQNITLCRRFYKNVHKMNDSLIELKHFTDYSIHSMNCFIEIAKARTKYTPFCNDVIIHRNYLLELQADLATITSFEKSMTKFGEVGYMLKCYYRIHSHVNYENGIRYACGFEGFINNLLGVHENINRNKISFAKLCHGSSCEFKSQYYPPLMDESPVKNNCSFDKNMIISSPNKSGKTTILKTTTINIIFTQQFGCGFYGSAKLAPYTHIHSYLNIPDTSGRDSLFQAESRRCKEIIDIINTNIGSQYRHFCIFDELYSGTNPEEASKAGYAFLKYLANYSNVNFILTTHYFSICKKFRKSSFIQNYKMEVNILENGTFEYTYKIKKGISKIKGAVRVLKDMDYPDEIIQTIENNSTD